MKSCLSYTTQILSLTLCFCLCNNSVCLQFHICVSLGTVMIWSPPVSPTPLIYCLLFSVSVCVIIAIVCVYNFISVCLRTVMVCSPSVCPTPLIYCLLLCVCLCNNSLCLQYHICVSLGVSLWVCLSLSL